MKAIDSASTSLMPRQVASSCSLAGSNGLWAAQCAHSSLHYVKQPQRSCARWLARRGQTSALAFDQIRLTCDGGDALKGRPADMFDSLEALRAAYGASTSRETGDAIAQLAKPSLQVVHGDGPHRLGGIPNLPGSVPWPIRAPLPHLALMEKEFGSFRPELVEAWGAATPMTFVASVDLAVAASTFGTDWPLPSRGTLFVFWDESAGCYGRFRETGRVIVGEPGGGPAEVPNDVRGWAARSFGTTRRWSLPGHHTLSLLVDIPEWGANRRFDDLEDGCWTQSSDRMLGWSVPVQQDPIFEAALELIGAADYPITVGEFSLVSDELSRHNEWTLVLQLQLSTASSGQWDEGSLYVVVPTSDCRAGSFERACVVYQQS